MYVSYYLKEFFILLVLLGLQEIKDWTKRSLETRLKKSLSCDWMPKSQAKKFPLRQYYVQLELCREIWGPFCDEKETLLGIHDLIEYIDAVNKGERCSATGTTSVSNVLIQGNALVLSKQLF